MIPEESSQHIVAFAGEGRFEVTQSVVMMGMEFSDPTFFPPFLAAPWHVEFPGQGSDLSHSCNSCRSCSNAGSYLLTHSEGPGIKPASWHCRNCPPPNLLFNPNAAYGSLREA